MCKSVEIKFIKVYNEYLVKYLSINRHKRTSGRIYMKLIDFHTHIYPDAVAEKATKSVEDFYAYEAYNIGTKDNLKKVAKEAGVGLCVILPVAVKPTGVQHINDYAAAVAKENSDFVSFGTLHAGMEDIVSEFQRIEKLGLRGIKIHPDTQLFDIDDKRMFPVYEMMAGKYILVAHTGDPRYSYSHPEKLRHVMKEFPKLRCIGAHFGGWSMADTGAEYLSDMENCYVDISSSEYIYGIEKCTEMVSRFGEDRVLFASDFPLGSPVKEKENLMKMKISDDAKEKIAYKNAERLLGIKI